MLSGKRKFIVALTALYLTAIVEYLNGTWSATGQAAIVVITITYIGGEVAKRLVGRKNGEPTKKTG